MRKFSWMLLVLLVLGCGEEVTKEEEKPEAVVETEPPPPDKITWEKDGKEMALIPAGNFMMGASDAQLDEKPVHIVFLGAFYMDVHEVTVGQFREFVNQSGYKYRGNWDWVAWNSPGDEYPMVYVRWNDAAAYAKWAGKRLPTEAEWEYAARGGLRGKQYPWGDEISHDNANYKGTGGKDKWDKCAPVGSFEANGYGLYDMGGNVWEWTADWYGEDYYSKSPAKNPLGPSTGSLRVFRGGSWGGLGGDASYLLRVAFRFDIDPTVWSIDLGFRCVADVP